MRKAGVAAWALKPIPRMMSAQRYLIMLANFIGQHSNFEKANMGRHKSTVTTCNYVAFEILHDKRKTLRTSRTPCKPL